MLNENITIESVTPITPSKIYKEFKYRYIILFCHCMINIFTAVTYVTCSPIMKDIKNVYDVSYLIISLSTLIYMIIYIPINFPCDYIMDHLGLRIGLTLGAILTIIGAWIRVFVYKSFYYVILGQFISSFGQPFIMNSPSKIAANWFLPKNRIRATTFLSIMGPIGIGIGFLIPGFIMGDETKLNNEEKKDKIYYIMFYEALVFTLLNIPLFILFKNKPKNPPSASEKVLKIPFSISFKKSLKNKNFVIFLFFHGFVYGCFNSMAVIINIILKPFDYTDFDNGLVGAFLIISGIIGSIIIGIITEKTHYYKYVLIISTLGYFISLLLLLTLISLKNIYILLISIIIMGFFGLPILPISYDLAVEINFPVGETFICGLLNCFTQFIAIISSIFLEFLFSEGNKNESLIIIGILAGMILFGLFILFFVKQNLRRNKLELNKMNSNESVYNDLLYSEN